VVRGGYSWWYVDAFSDDGKNGITIIALIGSVFSPYYAAMRRRPMGGDPLHHLSLNVAIYGEGKRWCMTERGRDTLRRDKTWLQIGPSSLEWDGDSLIIHIDEITAPFPRRLRGKVRVHHQEERRAGQQGHGVEAALGVPRRFLQHRAGREAAGRDHQRVAVGRGLGDHAGTDAATGAKLRGAGWVTVAALDENDSAAVLGCTHIWANGQAVIV
jgi:hypothetical protein